MLTALLPADLAEAVGAVTAVAAGLVLWVLAARLRVGPASRTAVVALYAATVLGVDLGAGPSVDGTGLLLLAAAATCAVGGNRWRTGLGTVLLAAAVAVMPVAAVGVLALVAGMAVAGDLARRGGRVGRALTAAVALAGAAAVAAALAQPGEPAALPAAVPAGLTLWTIVLAGVLWRRLPWLRAVAVAVTALLVCAWTPGPDADATLIVAAAVALLSAVVAEGTGRLLARRSLGVAAAVAVVAITIWISPGVMGPTVVPTAPAPVPAAVTERVRPVSVAIPAIGVRSPLEDLVADQRTRELAAPADPSRAGWFAAGVVPGEQGPAVLGGHVDSRRGPGVFFRLRALRPGDRVEVTRSDGRLLTFSVIAVGRYPKDEFPTAAVYGPTAGPELRLVTCGGRFDRSARSYDDNIVVDAVLT